MSKFVTFLPVDITSVLGLLPKRSVVEGPVVLNSQERRLELKWENDDFRTPFTYPVEWPLEALKAKEIPGTIRVHSRLVVEEGPSVPADAPDVPKVKPKKVK